METKSLKDLWKAEAFKRAAGDPEAVDLVSW